MFKMLLAEIMIGLALSKVKPLLSTFLLSLSIIVITKPLSFQVFYTNHGEILDNGTNILYSELTLNKLEFIRSDFMCS